MRDTARVARPVTVVKEPGSHVADLLVVPGVGHFGQCVRHFREAGFEELGRRRLAAATRGSSSCACSTVQAPAAASSRRSPDMVLWSMGLAVTG